MNFNKRKYKQKIQTHINSKNTDKHTHKISKNTLINTHKYTQTQNTQTITKTYRRTNTYKHKICMITNKHI